MATENHVEETNNLIFGQKNVFEKDYSEKTKPLGLSIKVKLRYPTISETAKIKAEMSRMFEGTQQDFLTSILYETLLMFKYVDEGTKVWAVRETEEGIEKELIKDYFSVDGYANFNVLRMIFEDFAEWQERFRY